MDACPICFESIKTAQVVCAGCGEPLPLQVLVISEGSQGGGFALVKVRRKEENTDDRSSPDDPPFPIQRKEVPY